MHHERIFKLDTVVIDNVRAKKAYEKALSDLDVFLEQLANRDHPEVKDIIDKSFDHAEALYQKFVKFVEDNRRYIDPREFELDNIQIDESDYYEKWYGCRYSVKTVLNKIGQSNRDVVWKDLHSAVQNIRAGLVALKSVADMAIYAYAVDHKMAANIAKYETDGWQLEDLKKFVNERSNDHREDMNKVVHKTCIRLGIGKEWSGGEFQYVWGKVSKYMQEVLKLERAEAEEVKRDEEKALALRDRVDRRRTQSAKPADTRTVGQWIKDLFKGGK